MNERIKQLALKAGLSRMPSNYSDMADLYKGADFELAKFAELIVRECAKSANEWYQNHDKIHSDPMSYVLTHFGVEE